MVSNAHHEHGKHARKSSERLPEYDFPYDDFPSKCPGNFENKLVVGMVLCCCCDPSSASPFACTNTFISHSLRGLSGR